MEQLVSGLSGKTYRVGAAIVGLGEGFYRGFDGSREVTLRIAAANTSTVAALRAEAALLERLDHPQIAAVQDRGRSERYYFLVFDGCAERPLAEVMHQAEISAPAAIEIVLQVLDILEVLHAAGICWGWLRPQAFWLDRAGRVKLVNLHGAGDQSFGERLTVAEATYLAPEGGSGQPPSARSDLYACGVLAYELLAGRPPYSGSTPAELAVKHLSESQPALGRARPELPPDLCALVGRCLAKSPLERPTSAAELRGALAQVGERLAGAEQARMVSCPRCQGRVLPAERCPLCNAPLAMPGPPPPRKRIKPLSLIAIGLSALVILCLLMSAFAGEGETQAAAPTSAPTATPTIAVTTRPTAEPTLLPTATAAPAPTGTISGATGDVADPNIDLIRVRVAVEGDQLLARIDVVGRANAPASQATYQVFLDVDDGAGGAGTPWPDLDADYTLIYQAGEDAATALRWSGTHWQGIGAGQVAIDGGALELRAPAEWLGNPQIIRYGILAANGGANLADYVPARGEPAALVASDE